MNADVENAIVRARQGEAAAYGLVVHEFQGRLRAFIATYCPDLNQVDEIAQRVFVWAYEHLQEYEPGTRFYSWVKAIARNMLLAELEVQRREARGKRRYLDRILIARAREEIASEGVREERDACDLLRACVGELPDHSRELLRRRYEEEEPVKSIARDLGKKESAMKVTLYRIRQTLRRCVETRRGPVGTVAP